MLPAYVHVGKAWKLIWDFEIFIDPRQVLLTNSEKQNFIKDEAAF